MLSKLIRRASLLLTVAATVALAPLCVTSAAAADEKPAATGSSSGAAAKTQDQLIMKNGNVVKGQILEETATSVVIMVEFPGMPAVKTTYPKTDIVEIKRKVDAPAGSTAPAAPAASSRSTPSGKDKNKTPDVIKEKVAPTATDEGTADKMMVLELKGRMGWDLSMSPFEEMFEAIDKEFSDLDESGKVKESFQKSHIVVLKMNCMTDPRRGFDGFFVAEKWLPLFDKQRAKGRRIIVWVDDLVGGGGMFALAFPEIYWTNEGRLRGTGDLDKFDIGDKMVNEKQISLRIGHAEGAAIQGGYGEVGAAIVRALSRGQNWLAARMEGGKPVVLERQPTDKDGPYNWFILKDDGKGDNKDKMETKGNDHLVLEADWARNLGISKGTCETEEDLAFALGIARNYKVIEKPTAQKRLDDWKDAIERAWEDANPRGTQEQPPGRLWRELAEVNTNGQTLRERQNAFGRQIQIYKQIKGLYSRFGEAWDPEGQFRSQIDVKIKEIEEMMQRDKRAAQRGGEN